MGLPVDGDWAATGYSLEGQGPVDALLDPVDAARRRLAIRVPRAGWRGGGPAPAWASPDHDAYLDHLRQNRLVRGLRAMLAALPQPADHHTFIDEEREDVGGPLLWPKLRYVATTLPADARVPRPGIRCPHWRWRWAPTRWPRWPWALACRTKRPTGMRGCSIWSPCPINLACLARRSQSSWPRLRGMVQQARPLDPQGLTACLRQRTRPSVLDGPVGDSVQVQWARPPAEQLRYPPLNDAEPLVAPFDAAMPTAYAVVREDGQSGRAELLLSPRPPEVGGWLAYAPGRTAAAAEVIYTDYLLRGLNPGIFIGTPRARSTTPIMWPRKTSMAAGASGAIAPISRRRRRPKPLPWSGWRCAPGRWSSSLAGIGRTAGRRRWRSPAPGLTT